VEFFISTYAPPRFRDAGKTALAAGALRTPHRSRASSRRHPYSASFSRATDSATPVFIRPGFAGEGLERHVEMRTCAHDSNSLGLVRLEPSAASAVAAAGRVAVRCGGISIVAEPSSGTTHEENRSAALDECGLDVYAAASLWVARRISFSRPAPSRGNSPRRDSFALGFAGRRHVAPLHQRLIEIAGVE